MRFLRRFINNSPCEIFENFLTETLNKKKVKIKMRNEILIPMELIRHNTRLFEQYEID